MANWSTIQTYCSMASTLLPYRSHCQSSTINIDPISQRVIALGPPTLCCFTRSLKSFIDITHSAFAFLRRRAHSHKQRQQLLLLLLWLFLPRTDFAYLWIQSPHTHSSAIRKPYRAVNANSACIIMHIVFNPISLYPRVPESRLLCAGSVCDSMGSLAPEIQNKNKSH